MLLDVLELVLAKNLIEKLCFCGDYVFLKYNASNFGFWERRFRILGVQGCRGKNLS